MFIGFVLNKPLDGWPRSAVLITKHCGGVNVGHKLSSYFRNLCCCKLGIRASCSAWRSGAALVLTVFNIILLSTKKQMAWVAAGWIIAFVKNAQPFWYFSKCKSPSQSVRANQSAVKLKGTVAIWNFSSSPVSAPVSIFRLNMSPKPLWHWYRNCLSGFQVSRVALLVSSYFGRTGASLSAFRSHYCSRFANFIHGSYHAQPLAHSQGVI